jgi:hypothetical protein
VRDREGAVVADAEWTAAAGALAEGLRAQREIYAELEAHTRRQGEIILGGRTEEILELANAKESTLARIDAIDRRIAPAKRRWVAERDRLPAALRSRVEEELDLLHDLLAGLIALEGDQQRRVDTARRDSSEQLRRIDGGRRLHQAYGAPGAHTPSHRFLDRIE